MAYIKLITKLLPNNGYLVSKWHKVTHTYTLNTLTHTFRHALVLAMRRTVFEMSSGALVECRFQCCRLQLLFSCMA